jgi:hypothetical protein
MKRIAFAIVLLFAVSAGADALQEWKTPDGKIFFGDQPPAGSIAVKRIDKPLGALIPPSSEPPPRTESQPEWRQDSWCRDLQISQAVEKPFDGINRRVVQGTVTHEGNHLVRDAKVCAARFCEPLRGGDSMAKGDREEFELDIVDVPNTMTIPLRIECSVRVPAA